MKQSFYGQVFYRLTGLTLEKSQDSKTRKYDIIKDPFSHFPVKVLCILVRQ